MRGNAEDREVESDVLCQSPLSAEMAGSEILMCYTGLILDVTHGAAAVSVLLRNKYEQLYKNIHLEDKGAGLCGHQGEQTQGSVPHPVVWSGSSKPGARGPEPAPKGPIRPTGRMCGI